MKIQTVTNNIITFIFNPAVDTLFIGDIVRIQSGHKGFLAQVTQIKFKETINAATANIILSINQNNQITGWQGNVPTLDAQLSKIEQKEFLMLTNQDKPDKNIKLGTITNLDNALFGINKLDLNFNTFVLYSNQEQKAFFAEKIIGKLSKTKEKILILDFNGEYSEIKGTRIKAGYDFRLPLNTLGLEWIYEKSLKNVAVETKALIEDIFVQVKEYAKEVEFIPFQAFKSAVEAQYEEKPVAGLVLLKNNLEKYEKEGIYTDKKENIVNFENAIKNNGITIIDLSEISNDWHKEFIDFIVSYNINELKSEFLMLFDANEKNFRKKIAEKLFVKGKQCGIKPLIFTNYNTPSISDILTYAQNVIMYKPLAPNPIFDNYSTMFAKLSNSEFIINGQATNYIPIFVQPEVGVKQVMPSYPQEDSDFEEEEIWEQDSVFEENDEDTLDFDESISEDDFEALDFLEEPVEEVSEGKEEEEFPQDLYDDVDSLYRAPASIVVETASSAAGEIRTIGKEIPIYPASIPSESIGELDFAEGDKVKHQKYGIGTVQKIINYGNKKLCSIQFEGIGRRLLDPQLAVIEKA